LAKARQRPKTRANMASKSFDSFRPKSTPDFDVVVFHNRLTNEEDTHMTIVAYPKSRRRNAKTAAPVPAPQVAPPSGALLNAILCYADVSEDIGAGLTVLRVSARRMNDEVITKMLGREAARLADVSILWHDDQSEIHCVLDAAIPTGVEDMWNEPQFELTDLALSYLEAEGSEADFALFG
jgi:hypothetical protein